MNSFQHKPLPKPGKWAALLGPGLVWMALAQGSGELIFWPRIIAEYGLGFLFLLIPACLLQFPLTFEVGRYTILTGEGLFRGFFRINKYLGIFIWILFIICFLWFGAFATAGGTAIAKLTEFPGSWTHESRTLFWAQTMIIVFTLAILYAKGIYRMIEWIMKVVAIISLLGMLFACCRPDVLSQLGIFLKGIFFPDVAMIKSFDLQNDTTGLLTAITFAGLGGFWSMFYSYWIKEKGAGQASHMDQMVGFRSGVNEIRSGEGSLPLDEPEALAKLKHWYRYLKIESIVGIVGNILTTLMTCLLAFVFLFPKGKVPAGYNVAVEQAAFFQESMGTFGKLLFLFIAGTFLVDTWLVTVDCVSRIHIDAITSIWPKTAKKDIRPLYYGLVILLAIITSFTMYFDQPDQLLELNAVLGLVGLLVYATTMIYLNHFHINKQLSPNLRSSRSSLVAIIFTMSCYYILAGLYIYFKYIYNDIHT